MVRLTDACDPTTGTHPWPRRLDYMSHVQVTGLAVGLCKKKKHCSHKYSSSAVQAGANRSQRKKVNVY